MEFSYRHYLGLSNRIANANFEIGLYEALKNFFDIALPSREGISLKAIVHELEISEQMYYLKETGICRTKIEFTYIKDGKEESIGSFESIIERSGIDVTGGHEKRINEALLDGVSQLIRTTATD